MAGNSITLEDALYDYQRHMRRKNYPPALPGSERKGRGPTSQQDASAAGKPNKQDYVRQGYLTLARRVLRIMNAQRKASGAPGIDCTSSLGSLAVRSKTC